MALPIDASLAEILGALASAGRVVVQAPPGSGKTTRVPAALLDEAGSRGRVVVLEPRRIAARAAADFVARERGVRLGGEVGYQVRFERCGDDATRLWFVTEGVLTRRFASDAFLDGVGTLVLDEFHERHWHGDIALAISLELQRTVRPDLRLVVMSATLETERLAAHLGGAPIVRAGGRPYPVTVHHLPMEAAPLVPSVSAALQRAFAESGSGDILVFLPGVGEIRRVARAAGEWARQAAVDLVELHGSLPLDQQRRAVAPSTSRRVILATNVAETALTIDGVTSVIDTGLARIARYDARHGFNALQVARISRAAADQRAGRAGRTAPGVCWRLWSEADHAGRVVHEAPEIERLDLAEMLLHVHAWGLAPVAELPWLDPPPLAARRRAEALLDLLGAVDGDGNLTETGRRMGRLGTSPRLARMLVESARRDHPATGALAAALAGERDLRRSRRAGTGTAHDRTALAERLPETPEAHAGSDLVAAAERFLRAKATGFSVPGCSAVDVDRPTALAVERAYQAFGRSLGAAATTPRLDAGVLGRCVLAGFPDRLARRREVGSARAVMVGGVGAILDADSAAAGAELFVALDADAGPRRQRSEVRIRSACAIEPEWIDEVVGQHLRDDVSTEFDGEQEAVFERRRRCYLDLVLDESRVRCRDATRAAPVLAQAALADPRRAFAFDAAVEAWCSRLDFAVRGLPEDGFPSSGDLLAAVTARLCTGRSSFAELRRVALLPELRRELPPHCLLRLDRELPESFELPSGRPAAIRYDGERAPVVAARVQELFGLRRTPMLCGGRVALTFELLAPNQRPVQITRDLESFWNNGYPEVRKQLRGRYPKHDWPEDPFTARASSRVRRSLGSSS